MHILTALIEMSFLYAPLNSHHPLNSRLNCDSKMHNNISYDNQRIDVVKKAYVRSIGIEFSISADSSD